MSSFNLQDATQHTLVHINARDEKHGTDHYLAMDLKVMASMSGDVLEQFGLGLRQGLYDRNHEGILAKLKYPMLKPLRWEIEFSGRAVTLDYGLGDDGSQKLDFGDGKTSNLQMLGCKLGKFEAAPQEGGTVIITYRIQVQKVEPEVAAVLLSLLKKSVWLVLPPPQQQPGDQAGQTGTGKPNDLVSMAEDGDGDDGEAQGVAAADGAGGGAQPSGDGGGDGGEEPDNDSATEAFIAAHVGTGAASTAGAEGEAANDTATRRGRRRPS